MQKYIYIGLLTFGLLLTNSQTTFAQKTNKFKIILDAGHGGTDSGKVAHGRKEKDIALEITKKVGALLAFDSNIQVVFTRSVDVFVTLKERANIANRNDADLFVSIHCNSAGNNFSPYGTETFVMGMSRTDTNLSVAKSENSVILLEDDYKEKYNGFDPNKPETLIGLKLLQEQYLNQSIDLAARVESNFANSLGRKSRGVKQQPLWVLDASYMPSVLIETGFLTNKDEGAYLESDKGQNEISTAIASAIKGYKDEYFIQKTSVIPFPNGEPKKELIKKDDLTQKSDSNLINEGFVFKIQLAASKTKLSASAANFNGLSPVSREEENGLYRYFYSTESDFSKMEEKLNQAKAKGYPSAFIVAYKNGEKISLSEAIK